MHVLRCNQYTDRVISSVTDEVESMWKETVEAEFNSLLGLGILLDRLRKATTNFGLKNWYLGRDLN